MDQIVLNDLKVLVLNDDYTPLNCISWKRAFKKIFATTRCEHCNGQKKILGLSCHYCAGRGIVPPARAIEYYTCIIRDSVGRSYPVPAVLVNSHHVQIVYRKVNFSRLNVLKRDNFVCQFCGKKTPPKELTLDHVIPKSRWKSDSSPTDWNNVVTSCLDCNTKKKNRTPEEAGMKLLQTPYQPTRKQIVFGKINIPKEWEIYVK